MNAHTLASALPIGADQPTDAAAIHAADAVEFMLS